MESGRVLPVAWYRFRATLGRRWGGYLAVVLVVGSVGGLAMGKYLVPGTPLAGDHAPDEIKKIAATLK